MARGSQGERAVGRERATYVSVLSVGEGWRQSCAGLLNPICDLARYRRDEGRCRSKR
jgi:hypothetical protein